MEACSSHLGSQHRTASCVRTRLSIRQYVSLLAQHIGNADHCARRSNDIRDRRRRRSREGWLLLRNNRVYIRCDELLVWCVCLPLLFDFQRV